VAVANVGEQAARTMAVDDQVWASWPPEAAIVLAR
jgi:hypothetical protein